ncbi:MAG: hypothetical protein R3F39_25120 [Myxococcota bacterium]
MDDVADEVEGETRASPWVGWPRRGHIEEEAGGAELFDDGGFAVGGGPAAEEVVEGGVAAADLGAAAVGQGLGDEAAVVAVVLDALAEHADGDAGDDVLGVAGGIGVAGVLGVGVAGRLVGAGGGAGRGIVDDDRVAVEVSRRRARWPYGSPSR